MPRRDTICQSVEDYDAQNLELARGNRALADIQPLIRDTTKKGIEIRRKEDVIVRQILNNKECYVARDSLKAALYTRDLMLAQKDLLITSQAQTIKDGGYVQPWALSLVAGGGYTFGETIQARPFVGLAVGRTLVRWGAKKRKG